VFSNFKQDLQRNLADYGAASPLRRFALALTLNSIHALALIRLQFWLARHHLPTILPAKLLFWFFKIEISSRATIGPGLRLPHPMGIIIAPNSHVGAHCDLYADVRLVLSHGRPQGPHLEDGVFMGDGAKAVGAVRIGAHSVIGVSAVVTRDIPPNAVAAGIPARVFTTAPSPMP
jgi:serine O-acetyltransferase